jgi:Peptidase A4 family
MISRMRRAVVVLAAAVAVVAVPAGASAASLRASSTNWAGYAARRVGVDFKRISGAWTVPAVDCSSITGPTYSANWVGLGGYAIGAQALEQLGTESDCSAAGRARYSAWFEVVPDVASTARLKIKPGDRIFASVTVAPLARRVTMTLADRTRGTKATKTVYADAVDLSSAEWIVEAPSLCFGSTQGSCTQTALAKFGATGFTQARATTTSGHTGGLLDTAWNAVALTLLPEQAAGAPSGPGSGPGGRGTWGPGGDDDPGAATQTATTDGAGSATPGALSADGSAFAVTYAGG